ncbi:ER lumen protein-retaining receptor 2 [Xenoophorus captivus]|uniref:ER lumen protein-retaining receptor n=1 Tax=Xenoophorus captivus TaxID=1517983 RepID=A0ABV0Q5W7_9TELE
MFVFSADQFQRLLRIVPDWTAERLLDLGAGDGGVTEVMGVHFQQVYATEVSPPMKWHLQRRNFTEVFQRVGFELEAVTRLPYLCEGDMLTGDLSHLAAIIILLLKIWKTRSCAGISGKSQVLFALVFTTRYLDLLTSFISLYNTTMKVIYIGCAYATVYLIYMKFKATYDGNHDTFRVEFLVVPVGGLAFLVNHDFSPLEILWTFSIYLESVAILPQLFMISKTGEAETITTHYLFFLGLYRALYLINWIWRFYFEGFFDMIAIVAGVVQTILYCDFFYLYVTKVLKGKKLSLPA